MTCEQGAVLRTAYPMLGLVHDAFPYRIAGPRFGRYGSLVLVAPCNFACPYCDVGGYAKDGQNNLPGWTMQSTAEIVQFVDDEVARGRIIYFSGGEPLMFPELIAHLGHRVRAAGGYSVVCTNASLKMRIDEVSPVVDEFSVSLKGSPAIGTAVSGVSTRLAFDIPYRNSLDMRTLPNVLEHVVVLFDDLEVETVCEIYEPFIGRAHVTLKEYRPKVTRAMPDHTYATDLLDDDLGDLHPMRREVALEVFGQLRRRYPDHAASFNLVLGGGGDQVVRNGNREHLFVR